MFDVSWGELFVVGAIGASLAGKRDLPNACRFVGSQIGRVVGLLQGARARADRFTAQNELRQLQNELRSGLRELDQVKTELAVAASMGRTLGATTSSANRLNVPAASSSASATPLPISSNLTLIPPASISGAGSTSNSTSISGSLEIPDTTIMSATELSPAIQSERATMEEEWEKQGIGFISEAEQGAWMTGGSRNNEAGEARTGSELLENIIRQNLIFDQYDRVVGEQENELQQRIEKVKEKRSDKRNKNKD